MLPPHSPARSAESANIQALETFGNMQKHRRNTRKYTAGGVVIFVAIFALTFCRGGIAVAQSGPTPTPLPQVIATQQSADAAGANVSGLQAERARTQAQLDEINRNIEAQIAAAAQAAADARNAAATQNAVEAGAAIGRLEGALAQLRESYAGKDAIIANLQSSNEQQAAQRAEDRRTIDRLGTELQQAITSKQNAVNAYNALGATQKQNQQNDMVSNAIWLIVALAFLLAMITLAAFVLQRRRDTAPVAHDAPIDVDYIVSDEDTP